MCNITNISRSPYDCTCPNQTQKHIVNIHDSLQQTNSSDIYIEKMSVKSCRDKIYKQTKQLNNVTGTKTSVTKCASHTV